MVDRRKCAVVNQQMRLIKLASHQQVELIKRFISRSLVFFIPFLDRTGDGDADDDGNRVELQHFVYRICFVLSTTSVFLFFMIICATHFHTAQHNANTLLKRRVGVLRKVH